MAGVWRNPRRCQRNETLIRSGGCRRPHAVAHARPPTRLLPRLLRRPLRRHARGCRSRLPPWPRHHRHRVRTCPRPSARCAPVVADARAARPLPTSSARWRSGSRSLPAGSCGDRCSLLRATRLQTTPSNRSRRPTPRRLRAMRCPPNHRLPPSLSTMRGPGHDRRGSIDRRKSRQPCLRATR